MKAKELKRWLEAVPDHANVVAVNRDDVDFGPPGTAALVPPTSCYTVEPVYNPPNDKVYLIVG